MTQIDVLKMAIEAGLAAETSDGRHQIWYPDNLHHFAKLVAAKEREACANLCWKNEDENAFANSYNGKRLDLLCAELIKARGEQA